MSRELTLCHHRNRWKPYIFAVLVVLTFDANTAPSQAEPSPKTQMEHLCEAATPAHYKIIRWKPAETCQSDCFAWRVICADGKTYKLVSKFHPATTQWQLAFYNAAPWSILLYMSLFLLLAGLAIFGTHLTVPLFAANALLMGWLGYAGWWLYASITGNPSANLERDIFLNLYVNVGVALAFLAVNVRPALRGLETLFYHHGADVLQMPLVPAQGHGFATVVHFQQPEDIGSLRREIEEFRAFRQKLDAEAALAEAIIRRRLQHTEF